MLPNAIVAESSHDAGHTDKLVRSLNLQELHWLPVQNHCQH